jgi:sortase A
MRIVVKREPLRRILKGAQGALFACAVLFLGYCGFAWADSQVFQWRENRYFDRQLVERRAVGEGTPQPVSLTPRKSAPAAAPDGLIGRIEIPRLLFSAVVLEGIDKTTLRRVVGHIPGTALPGQPGNVGLAGHRDTFFRPLKDLRARDEIQFSTVRGDFKYVVESLLVVEPENVSVLAPSGDNVLTLVTCYPFFYVGAAPRRFVVRARQVSPPVLTALTVE